MDKHDRLLCHTIGLSAYPPFGRREHDSGSCRNHYVASAGHHGMPTVKRLEDRGLMVMVQPPAFLDSEAWLYMATEEGILVALAAQREAIRKWARTMTRSSFRYLRWLEEDSTRTFGEFLCHEYGRGGPGGHGPVNHRAFVPQTRFPLWGGH